MLKDNEIINKIQTMMTQLQDFCENNHVKTTMKASFVKNKYKVFYDTIELNNKDLK